MSLADVPGRVFLDTSVVNFVLKFGEQIHDNVPPPVTATIRESSDIEALRGLFVTGARAAWQFAVSPTTYAEVAATKGAVRRRYLEGWFFELWHYWQTTLAAEDCSRARINREVTIHPSVLRHLPDKADRSLLRDAVGFRCDAFCTRDWHTILSHRDKLIGLPLSILTPSEWWKLVRPYAALWA